MEYSSFLDSLEDTDLRNKLWNLYSQAEKEAKSFSIDPGDWVDIKRVLATQRSIWHSHGEIEIYPNWTDLGQIFHETFHSAFHNSPLWRDENKRDWGDGFCDAFRYFMEDRYAEDSRWLDNINSYLPRGIEEILENHKNIGWKLNYCIPCTRIVNKVDKDYAHFKRTWKELNENPEISLEDYFGYPKRELALRFRQ